MAEPTPRCSALSCERGESMLGTAFAQSGVLLVEQPGPWGHAGLTESHFDPAVAGALEGRAAEAGLRVFAIRRLGRHVDTAAPRRWAVLPARSADPPVVYWSSFDADAELLDVALDGSAGTPDPDPLYLVCAHSKRDVCCALSGRPLAAALDALRPGRVWECSHTGGHRFAPNLLALPVGALYGRVPDGTDELAGLVALTERGEVAPWLLRGMIGHRRVEQVAIGALLDKLGEPSPGAVTVNSCVETGPDHWRAALRHAGGERWWAEIDVEIVPTPYSSCGRPKPKPQPQYTVELLAAAE